MQNSGWWIVCLQSRGGFCPPSPTVCYHRSSSTFQTRQAWLSSPTKYHSNCNHFYLKLHCYLGASIQSIVMFFSPKMETAMVYLKSIGELFAVLPHKWSFSLGLDPARDKSWIVRDVHVWKHLTSQKILLADVVPDWNSICSSLLVQAWRCQHKAFATLVPLRHG